ncbi:MAG: hypothetical protein EOP49_15680, partial [Sphingobacteriales bacterium]
MRSILIALIAAVACCCAQAQDIEAYRSTKNPYYWKNRKPDPGYWQQDVHYKIDARVDEQTHVITASETLSY